MSERARDEDTTETTPAEPQPGGAEPDADREPGGTDPLTGEPSPGESQNADIPAGA